MKVLDPGHRYRFLSLDAEHVTDALGRVQVLQFVKREGEKFPGNVGTAPGTTSQDVLRALIDRAKYVNRQIPCWQTRLSIPLMMCVVWLYEHRAARRHNRRAPGFHEATYGVRCGVCGHVHAGFCP